MVAATAPVARQKKKHVPAAMLGGRIRFFGDAELQNPSPLQQRDTGSSSSGATHAASTGKSTAPLIIPSKDSVPLKQDLDLFGRLRFSTQSSEDKRSDWLCENLTYPLCASSRLRLYRKRPRPTVRDESCRWRQSKKNRPIILASPTHSTGHAKRYNGHAKRHL